MTPRQLALLVACGTGWASTFMFVEVGLDSLGPETIVAVRNFAAAAMLLALMAVLGLDIRRAFARPLLAIAAGAFGYTLPLLLVANAQEQLPTGVLSVIVASGPMILACAAPWVIPNERMGLRGFVGLSVGLAGVGLAAHDGMAGGVGLGPIALVVGAAISNIIYPVIVSKSYSAEHPVLITTHGTIGAAVIGLVLLPLFPAPGGWHTGPFAAAIATGVVSTAIPFAIFATLIAEVGSMRASLAQYWIPVAGTVFGITFLHEQLHPGSLVGLVLIVLGVALAAGGGRAVGRARTLQEQPVA